ncbi:MAG: POTRA domain-containing protein [Pseudomonadota bacterium]
MADTLRVEIRGVDDTLRENIAAHIGSVKLRQSRELSRRERDRLIANGIEKTREALRPYGYYAPEIDARVTSRRNGDPVLELRVRPGSPMLVAEAGIRVSGDTDAKRQMAAWLADWPLAVGARLDQTLWEDHKEAGLRQAQATGYLDAEYAEQNIALDLIRNTASLDLELDAGERYVMGSIDFGEHVLRPDVVQSIPRFEEGDYYSSSLMDRFRVDLRSSGYFTDVEVTEHRRPDAEPPVVDLRLALETAFRSRYQGAIGFGSDTGFRLQGNFSRQPMSSRGDRIDVGIGWREVDEEFALRSTYRRPRRNRQRQYWLADATVAFENRDLEFKRRDEDKDFIQIANGNIAERHLRLGQLTVRNFGAGDQQVLSTLFVQLLNSRNDYASGGVVDGVTVSADDIDRVVQGVDNAVSVGLEVDLVDIEGKRFETRGKRDRFWLFTSLYSLNDSGGFTQAYASTRRAISAGERLRLLLRGEVAYTESRVDRIDLPVGADPLELSVTRLPSFYRFRAGGGASVRGYAFEQLSNNNVGSNHLLAVSAELEARVFENWSVAAFVDTGNAFNDWSEPELKTGMGLGLRWYSIAGPIRIDFAQARDFTGRPWRVHLTIGTPLL